MSDLDTAKERFAQYFHRKAARDNVEWDDIPHLREADRLERSGEVDLGFKKVQLKGNYQAPPGYESEMGRCVRRAIREAAKIDVENLPDVVGSKDLPAICSELGLTYHAGPKQISLPQNTDIIVLYETGADSAHAIVTDNLAEFSKKGKKIVGMIEVPKTI